MCPVAEMRLREKEGLLHLFEIGEQGKSNNRKPRADPARTVKEYSRPAAGRTDIAPSDVRPPAVLITTVQYLFQHVVPRETDAWARVYDFVFDRLRSVRQDVVVQCMDGVKAITLMEQMVCFHAYAGYRLCEAPLDAFDPVINDQHLLECLKRLLRLYATNTGPHDMQAQFEAVYLSHNLGSTDSLRHALSLPDTIRQTKIVREALAVNLAFLQGNYARFFRLMSRMTSTLSLCSLHRHFPHVRMHGLRVMSAAYSSKNCHYPVSSLQRALCVGRGPLMELAHACGLVEEGDVTTAQHIAFQRTKFSAPPKLRMYREKHIDTRLEMLNLPSWLLGQHSGTDNT